MRTLMHTLLFLSLALTVGPAVGVEAVVADIGAPPDGPQKEIELTYRSGLLDLLLGRYRVTSVQVSRVDARAVSASSPPSEGMRVTVTAAQTVPLPTGSGKTSPPAADVAQEGRVVFVQGRVAEIELPSGLAVRPGDRFSLAFEAPRVGRVAIQGIWRVTRIAGNRVQTEPEGATGQPRVGQIAILLSSPAQAEGAAPSGLDKGKAGGGKPLGGGDIQAPDLDALLAEKNYKEGMRLLRGDGMPADRGKAVERLREAAQLGHAGARQELDALEQSVPPADSGVVERGWIGLFLQGLPQDLARTLGLAPDTQGSLVADVVAGGPAALAGLHPGDVILEIDGQPAVSHHLAEKVRQSAPGTPVRLWIWRKGSRLFLAVRVGTLPWRP